MGWTDQHHKRLLALGLITGVRSMAGPALVSYLATQGLLRGIERSRLGFLASEMACKWLGAAAVSEAMADKLPGAPGRNSLPLMTGRAAAGALVGAAVSISAGKPVAAGAALTGSVAAATSWLAYHIRTGMTQKLKLPNMLVGLAEDAAVIAGSSALMRNWSNNKLSLRQLAGAMTLANLSRQLPVAQLSKSMKLDQLHLEELPHKLHLDQLPEQIKKLPLNQLQEQVKKLPLERLPEPLKKLQNKW